AVAVADVDVDREPLEATELFGLRVRQMQVRDVDIRLHGRVVNLAQETKHAVHVVDERELERLQLQGDLQAQFRRMLAQAADIAGTRLPLVGRGNHLSLPDVLAQDQEQVPGLELIAQVKKGATALQVKALHGRIEVDEANGHAGHADDGQARPV